MIENINGMSIEIIVSDPWDFVTVNGSGPFLGKILETGTIQPTSSWGSSSSLFIKLDKILVFRGVVYEFIIASPRYKENEIESLIEGKIIDCAMIRIPKEKVTSISLFDLNWWRGGHGLQGTIRLIK